MCFCVQICITWCYGVINLVVSPSALVYGKIEWLNFKTYISCFPFSSFILEQKYNQFFIQKLELIFYIPFMSLLSRRFRGGLDKWEIHFCLYTIFNARVYVNIEHTMAHILHDSYRISDFIKFILQVYEKILIYEIRNQQC